jgi:type II secretory pathway pseudopilin PulG
VSLSVLGLIAALTLPSIFNAVEKSKRLAVLKETVNVLYNAAEQARNQDGFSGRDIPDLPKVMKYISCTEQASNARAAGYWPDPQEGGTAGYSVCKLANGAVLIYHSGAWLTHLTFYLDWNGTAGTNTYWGGANPSGERVVLRLHLSETPTGMFRPYELKPGYGTFQQLYAS